MTVAQWNNQASYSCPGMDLFGMKGKNRATKTSKIYCSMVFLVREEKGREGGELLVLLFSCHGKECHMPPVVRLFHQGVICAVVLPAQSQHINLISQFYFWEQQPGSSMLLFGHRPFF